MSDAGQTRRQFCTRAVSVAAFGGVLGTILQGCGGGNPASPSSFQSLPVVSGSDVNGGVVVNVDAASPLAAVGSAALVQSPGALVLVAHTAQDSFTALSAMCTHAACTVQGWANGRFVCPCHGSQFSTTGQVVNGPAFAPLRQYNAQFASGVLTITA
jgi:cytochrome b6-f complex iron-sulfur subunit